MAAYTSRASSTVVALINREAQAIAALNHPAIVTIYSVEEDRGTSFLTMELVEGRPLSDLIPSGGLPLPRVLEIGFGMGEATAHILSTALKKRDIQVTRLAKGVPIGSELEFVDLGTIAHALMERR